MQDCENEKAPRGAGQYRADDDKDLDPKIASIVMALRAAGVETFESCQGGTGHTFAEPTVRFFGGRSAGYKAYAAAVELGMDVTDLRRVWPVIEGELTGPWWEMVFSPVT